MKLGKKGKRNGGKNLWFLPPLKDKNQKLFY